MKTQLLTLSAVGALLALSTSSVFAKAGWTDDYEKAKATAKAEKKMVLINFTGSDWCGWCIKLDKEVFSKPAFKEHMKDKYVLVELDFPQTKKLPEKKKAANEALSEKYKVQGFPTLVVLDSEGNQVGELGYVKGGPEAFIAELDKVATKSGS
jgi:protein disulfide-isomerase